MYKTYEKGPVDSVRVIVLFDTDYLKKHRSQSSGT